MSSYYTADGMPLRPGDLVTRAENVPDVKFAADLIEGVVLEDGFYEGRTASDGGVMCKVQF